MGGHLSQTCTEDSLRVHSAQPSVAILASCLDQAGVALPADGEYQSRAG